MTDQELEELAKAAHRAYHTATKDWPLIPTWDAPNCLKEGWRAVARAVVEGMNSCPYLTDPALFAAWGKTFALRDNEVVTGIRPVAYSIEVTRTEPDGSTTTYSRGVSL